MVDEASLTKLPPDPWQWASLMISQHWFRYRLGTVRQQTGTRADVDPDPCRLMASISHNELKLVQITIPCWLIWHFLERANGLMPAGPQTITVAKSGRVTCYHIKSYKNKSIEIQLFTINNNDENKTKRTPSTNYLSCCTWYDQLFNTLTQRKKHFLKSVVLSFECQ